MRIRKKDKWKIAYYITYGYFEYQVISFDFFNASTNFPGYNNKLLVEKLDFFVIVYRNNFLI